ncbi:hypothetical protein [Xanthomonas arboricola]|uniref:hypothetical protein n=1 Tax=Xanthomonas arboricola TaxID=56448 RepID=UPI000A47F88E|nr:hypothetical protein [Xanthomonas arboricola]
MLSRDIRVEINTKSWKTKPRPVWAKSAHSLHSVDIGQALLLLGTITTPNGISVSSPERYWACVRYFSACANTGDLRIRAPFSSLDPHQKSILSDDFGVAISTTWLINMLGGVKEVVDGRQFMLNMGTKRKAKKPAAVGPSKCPDFVLEDLQGKLHVLECKGTQSGRKYLDRAINAGVAQKKGIKIAKTLRGEALVIGLTLANERSAHGSQLVVVDPQPRPLTVVSESSRIEVAEVMARLRLARALSLSGFSSLGLEISLPKQVRPPDAEFGLLTFVEKSRLAISPTERRHIWHDDTRSELRDADLRTVDGFLVQTMHFELPSIILDSGELARRVTVRRGIEAGLVNRLAEAGSNLRDRANSEAADLAVANKGIALKSTENTTRLEYPDFFFGEIIFD